MIKNYMIKATSFIKQIHFFQTTQSHSQYDIEKEKTQNKHTQKTFEKNNIRLLINKSTQE